MTGTRTPIRGSAYVVTLGVLLVLTTISWLLSQVSLGALGPVIALTIAGIKAAVVAFVFMHLAHGTTADRMAAVATILFIGLLCLGIVADVALR